MKSKLIIILILVISVTRLLKVQLFTIKVSKHTCFREQVRALTDSFIIYAKKLKVILY